MFRRITSLLFHTDREQTADVQFYVCRIKGVMRFFLKLTKETCLKSGRKSSKNHAYRYLSFLSKVFNSSQSTSRCPCSGALVSSSYLLLLPMRLPRHLPQQSVTIDSTAASSGIIFAPRSKKIDFEISSKLCAIVCDMQMRPTRRSISTIFIILQRPSCTSQLCYLRTIQSNDINL